MGFAIGLLIFGAALWLLYRLKARDVANCRAVLDLALADGRADRGTTPEGFAYDQRALLQGTMLGRPAVLWSRTVRHPRFAAGKRRSSEFTVLEFTLPQPVRGPLRLQPAGVLGALEGLLREPAGDLVAIDPVFDAAYVVHARPETGVLLILDPARREQLLAFRARMAGELPASSAAGRLSSGLVLGTFQLHGSTASYTLFGSPVQATAEHVKAAAPLLLDLAAAAGFGGDDALRHVP